MAGIGSFTARSARVGGWIAAFCFVLGGGAAAGPTGEEPLEGPPAREFRIADSFCFMPCLSTRKTDAKDRRSDIVTISRAELSGPMIQPCDGLVSVTAKEGSQEEVMQELRQRYGETALTSAAQIVLPRGSFKTGTATCTPKGGTPSTFARLLSIEPERVMLLTDDGIVYELMSASR